MRLLHGKDGTGIRREVTCHFWLRIASLLLEALLWKSLFSIAEM